MDTKRTGILFIVIAALMWSIEPILAKFSYENSSVVETFAIRCFIITVIAFFYVILTKGKFKIKKSQFPPLLSLALIATFISEWIYLYALTKTQVINVVILGHTQPLFIAILAYVFLKEEKLSKHDYLGIFMMILAGILVTTKTLGNLTSFRILSWIDFTIILVAISWSATAIIMKKYLKDLNAGTIVLYRYGISSILLFFYLTFTQGFFVPNVYQILLGITIGIGIIFYYESLKRIKAAQTASFELIAPFFASALSYFIFKESVTLMQIFALVFLFAGVQFLSRKE